MTNGETSSHVEARRERADGLSWHVTLRDLPSFVIGRLVISLLALLAIEHSLCAAAPYLRLREATLGYHGTEAEVTNATEIRIGWFGPTNLNDPLTGDLWWAANQAIREANEEQNSLTNSPSANGHSSFSSLPFRLIPRWAADPWGSGVSQLTRMVYDEQPLALLGSVDSASTHLAEQVVAKANLPLVSPVTTDKSVTLAGVSWMFSCAPDDSVMARALVDAVVATEAGGKPARFALLTCTDHESRMTAREVVKEFSRRGAMPDFRFDVPPAAEDICRQMQALVDARPARVVIVAGPTDAARLVRVVRERLGSVTIFGSHSMGRTQFLKLAGPAAEGMRFPLLCDAGWVGAKADRFSAQFAAERGYAPDYAAIFTYDATRSLIEAIRRAGLNRARIREALTALSPWSGIAGPVQFDGTGQNTRTNVALGTIRGGVIVSSPARKDLAHTTCIHSQP